MKARCSKLNRQLDARLYFYPLAISSIRKPIEQSTSENKWKRTAYNTSRWNSHKNR